MFKDANTGSLTLTLTSRGGWGCAELNSVPKGGIIHWSEWEVGRENGFGGEGGRNVMLPQGCCQILSGCRATRGVCAPRRASPRGGGGDTPPRRNAALNVVPACTRVPSGRPSGRKRKTCCTVPGGWWQGEGRYRGNSRKALWSCPGTPRLARSWDLPVACTPLRGFIVFFFFN